MEKQLLEEMLHKKVNIVLEETDTFDFEGEILGIEGNCVSLRLENGKVIYRSIEEIEDCIEVGTPTGLVSSIKRKNKTKKYDVFEE